MDYKGSIESMAIPPSCPRANLPENRGQLGECCVLQLCTWARECSHPASVLTSLPAFSPASLLSLTASHGSSASPGPTACPSPQPTGAAGALGQTTAWLLTVWWGRPYEVLVASTHTHTGVQPSCEWLGAQSRNTRMIGLSLECPIRKTRSRNLAAKLGGSFAPGCTRYFLIPPASSQPPPL